MLLNINRKILIKLRNLAKIRDHHRDVRLRHMRLLLFYRYILLKHNKNKS